MKQRIDYSKFAPDALQAMFALGKAVADSGLEHSLVELVKIRVSQINGCAFCIDMHTKDAREAGETEQRIYALSAWRETPFFTDRERAALAWAEALTHPAGGVSDELYERTRKQFDEKEVTYLTWAVVNINGWNRVAISAQAVPGSYNAKTKSFE